MKRYISEATARRVMREGKVVSWMTTETDAGHVDLFTVLHTNHVPFTIFFLNGKFNHAF